MRRLWDNAGWVCLISSGILLFAGIAAAILGQPTVRDASWIVAGVIGLMFSIASVVEGLMRRTAGVDILALLAVAGALVTKEYLAAALVAVMLGTGAVLEQWAEKSAHRELGMLVARTPKVAHQVTETGFNTVPVDEVNIGDWLHVAVGEIVPVDGHLLVAGTFDEAALTGESRPVDRQVGDLVRSGVINSGSPVQLVAAATAAESSFADVVRLVKSAAADSAPYVRFADRIAWWFIPLTLILGGLAWAISGDPVRMVAVLVVATPCPLLLAVPIAVVSGVSQAAKRGVVVKGGAVLERLAEGKVLLFDKTGTLTQGRPDIEAIHTAPGIDSAELLRYAGSLDQASPHILASAIVRTAHDRGIGLQMPQDVQEAHGNGIRGIVDGRPVSIGKASWILGGQDPAWARLARREADLEGCVITFVALDDQPAGALLFVDTLRPDSPRMIRSLRTKGLNRTVLVTGDRTDLAESVARLAGVDDVRAEQLPADKVAVVTAERSHGPVIMVGDGINDAPALAAADVGVAMAGRGATASSEVAGVVLTMDRIDRLGDAIVIAKRARRIAAQSAWIGMGLSAIAMVAAALGFLPPAVGALCQEIIDILAIGNALRVGLFTPEQTKAIPKQDMALLKQIAADHESIRPIVDDIRRTADLLGQPPVDPSDPLVPLRQILVPLENQLLPHELQEEKELLPVMAQVLGGLDPVGAMSRTHAEIEHHIQRLRRTADEAVLDDPILVEDSITDARRTLYSLYGVLKLHNAQEDEGLFSLIA